MWKKVLVGFAVLGVLGLPVWGQEGEGSPNADWARALEIREEVASAGEFSGEAELDGAWIEALRQEFGPESPQFLLALHKMGMFFYQRGQYHESLRFFEQEVKLSAEFLGSKHPDTLTAKANLASILRALGDLVGARQRYEEVLKARIQILGSEHSDTLTVKANLADTLRALGDFAGAKQLEEEVLEVQILRLGSEHSETLLTKNNLATTLQALGDLARAKRYYEEVLEGRTHLLGADHPGTLTTKANLAGTLYTLGDLAGAKQRYEEVLDALIRIFGTDHHPKILAAKGNLAVTLRALGDLAGAKQLAEEVLDGRTRLLGSDHPDTLTAMNNLAVALSNLGDLAGAKRRYDEVLEVLADILGTKHPKTLMAKANVAGILHALGDLAGAKQRYREVLEGLTHALGPDHPETLMAKTNLGATLHTLGDLAGAKYCYEDVLDVRKRILGNEHPKTLTIKNNLAGILLALGDMTGAKQRYWEVFRSRNRTLGTEHPHTLKAKANLAVAFYASGDLAEAKQWNVEVFESRTRILGAEHPDTLISMQNLASILREEGELHAAEKLFKELIRSQRKALGPDNRLSSSEVAQNFYGLGLTQRDLGLLDEAFTSFSASLDALEAQVLRADFSEDVKSRYKTRYERIYRDTIEIALAREAAIDAFRVLERFRSQSLLSLLRWGHPASEKEIPEEIRIELAENTFRYDRITEQLYYTELDPKERETLLKEQTDLYYRREIIQGQIIRQRQEKEGFPEHLEFEEIQNALDPGTLLLAFSIGEESSYLFTLDHQGQVEAHDVEATAPVLQEQIARFRNILVEESNEESLRNLSSWLYERLFPQAARGRIAQATRLLILPDGPLYNLPFSALVFPSDDNPRGWQYLIEHKSLHTVQSVNVYAELRARRSRAQEVRSPWQWIGFGAPLYPEGAEDSIPAPDNCDTLPPSSWNPLEALATLPSSRHEIQAIASQFPAGQAKIYSGSGATEGKARQIPPGTRILHFASHGIMLCRAPMDSFLALSLVDIEDEAHNGLLQAWEIADLKLDADLVILSACVTAAGQNVTGEGLISLSRAFQVAGARSVLASLWAVNDASTAELMIRFYRHLLDEDNPKSKDEALRAAQLELIRGGEIEVKNEIGETEKRDFSHPYHWAAFQLIGDWR